MNGNIILWSNSWRPKSDFERFMVTSYAHPDFVIFTDLKTARAFYVPRDRARGDIVPIGNIEYTPMIKIESETALVSGTAHDFIGSNKIIMNWMPLYHYIVYNEENVVS